MMLSLVVPRCDDARLMARLTEGTRQLKSILPYPFEVVCVFESRAKPPPATPDIRWVEVNRGSHGYRVRAGMLAAQGLYRVLIDPRWTVSPEQIQMMLPPVHTHFDICLGSRRVEGASRKGESPIARVLRRGWSQISGGALKPRVADFLAPIQVYRSDAARALFSRAQEEGQAVTVEVLAIADQMGLIIHEQPIDFDDHFSPKSRLLAEGLDLLVALGRIRLRLESGAYPMLNLPVAPTLHRRVRA